MPRRNKTLIYVIGYDISYIGAGGFTTPELQESCTFSFTKLSCDIKVLQHNSRYQGCEKLRTFQLKIIAGHHKRKVFVMVNLPQTSSHAAIYAMAKATTAMITAIMDDDF